MSSTRFEGYSKAAGVTFFIGDVLRIRTNSIDLEARVTKGGRVLDGPHYVLTEVLKVHKKGESDVKIGARDYVYHSDYYQYMSHARRTPEQFLKYFRVR